MSIEIHGTLLLGRLFQTVWTRLHSFLTQRQKLYASIGIGIMHFRPPDIPLTLKELYKKNTYTKAYAGFTWNPKAGIKDRQS